MLWPVGVGHVHFETIDSTNAYAKRVASQTKQPIWISADEQTAGKGRRGRDWSTTRGNFAASLLMPSTAPPAVLALHSFVAALAVGDALDAVLPHGHKINYKWPNDVLLDGRKLVGILLENIGSHLIIGIGINTQTTPDRDKIHDAVVAATDLAGQVDNTVMLAQLAAAFAQRVAQFSHYGFAHIRRDWLARAAKLGEQITGRTMHDSITGRFETLDEQGQLILQQGRHKYTIAAADVFFTERGR